MSGISFIRRYFNDSVNIVTILTSDSTAVATASGYLTAQAANIVAANNGAFDWLANDTVLLSASDGNSWCSVNASFTTLTAQASLSPAVTSVAVSSATPGTVRALTGKVSESAPTMTSGNITGVRGEADLVSASGGFVYGVQGKVIPTGTLSGSVWAPAVFGQYDLSAATLNAGQIAAIWGDMGASGGTFTDVTGARMFAGTNTIASLTLNSMIYLYGKATNLFELSGSSSTYISAGAATPGGDLKKIAITIDGVTHYILAAATWS